MPCTTIWPKKNVPSARLQIKIERAVYNLARNCLLADIDLTYVDADGLLVKVVRPKKPRKKR
jgi:hypothetical protein